MLYRIGICVALAGLVSILASCDSWSYGEGFHDFGLSKKCLDGHMYVLYRTENGCALLHDIDCRKCKN